MITLFLSTVWLNKACIENNYSEFTQIKTNSFNQAFLAPCITNSLNCWWYDDQCDFGQALVDQLNQYQQCIKPDHTGALNQYCQKITKWFDYNDLSPFNGNFYYPYTHFCDDIECYNPNDPSTERFYCNGFELHNNIYSGDIIGMHAYATLLIEDNNRLASSIKIVHLM